MARQYLTDIDLSGNQLIDARVENLSSDPTAGNAGRVFFNTTSGEMKYDTGSAIALFGGTVDWANITNKPTEFTPSAHTHTASEVTDFATAVNTQIIAYWDSIAGTDADVDTIRETLDKILANAAEITSLPQKYETNIGNASATSFTVSHNLGTSYVIVSCADSVTGSVVVPDVAVTNSNTVTITTSSPPANDGIRVTVTG